MEVKDHANEDQKMLQQINLHEDGLRFSPRLKENAASSSIKHKAHVNFGSILLKDIYLFTLLCNVKDSITSMPDYHLRTNYFFTSHAVHQFHELNELYDGTVNQIHHLAFATDVSSNEVFKYHKAMKEADAELFVSATKKEIPDHGALIA